MSDRIQVSSGATDAEPTLRARALGQPLRQDESASHPASFWALLHL